MSNLRFMPLTLLPLIAACATPQGAGAPAPKVKVGLLAINDFHGALEMPRQSVFVPDGKGEAMPVPAGGAAYLASAIDSLKAQHPNHLVVSAGDLIGASQLEASTVDLSAEFTGLITTQAGQSLPNHLTVMAVAPGERSLAADAKTLSLRFESPEVGGVKLAKTFTFTRGQYTVDVKHEVSNAGAAAVQPQLYLQLVRDGNPPAGESSFYFTFTGPAIYTDANGLVEGNDPFQVVWLDDVQRDVYLARVRELAKRRGRQGASIKNDLARQP